MKIMLNTPLGKSCVEVSAAPSAQQAELDYSVSFMDDYNLRSKSGGPYNHWVFPLDVVAGMNTPRLRIEEIVIPPACNVTDKYHFASWTRLASKPPPVTSAPCSGGESCRAAPRGWHNATERRARDWQDASPPPLTPFVLIDTHVPFIVGVTAAQPAGEYTAGDRLTIIVELSRPVAFREMPSADSQAKRRGAWEGRAAEQRRRRGGVHWCCGRRHRIRWKMGGVGVCGCAM
jgi:hypothetical protein